MGAFLVNVHVRTDDHEKLAAGLRALPIGGCWVAPAANGWATVFEERASTQDDQWIRKLAAATSREAHAATIAFLIHDSDIFCYWLFDRGELLDEFNSCPDYFGDTGGGAANHAEVQGRPDVLLPFCSLGTQLPDLVRVLQEHPTFAEDQMAKLANLLGIAVERAMVDYRDIGDEQPAEELGLVFVGDHPAAPSAPSRGPSFLRLVRDDEDAGNDEDVADDGGAAPPHAGGLPGPDLAQFLGFAPGAAETDPLVRDLVQAAAEGNLAEIDRLVAAGAPLTGRARLTRSPPGLLSPGTQLMGSAPLGIPVSPLYAAVAGKQLAAARRLIELGADVNESHPLLGAPVHTAATGGAPDLLRLLLDSGADVNEFNSRRQTPLQALDELRKVMSQFGNLGSLGATMPESFRSQIAPLAQAWDACARLLADRGGQ